MADFSLIGHIEGILYRDNFAVVTVSENKKGYKKNDGTLVEDTMLTWHILYKKYFKKFLVEHFRNGMYVAIKGEILPYKIVDGKMVEGASVIGQTINLAPYPKNTKKEKKMFAESQINATSMPDLESFEAPDF